MNILGLSRNRGLLAVALTHGKGHHDYIRERMARAEEYERTRYEAVGGIERPFPALYLPLLSRSFWETGTQWRAFTRECEIN